MTTHFESGRADLLGRFRLGICVAVFCATGCGPSHVEELIEAARSPDPETRHAALRELAELGMDAKQATPVLVGGTQDDDPETARLSCFALGQIYTAGETPAESPVPADVREVLAASLNGRQTSLRMTAAYALLATDADNADAQAVLLTAMQRGDGGVIDRIGRRKPPPTWAVETLIEILSGDRRPGNRRLAAVALGRIGVSSDVVRAALEQASEDEEDRVRAAAQESLLQIDGPT